jgi:hypothetical protein
MLMTARGNVANVLNTTKSIRKNLAYVNPCPIAGNCVALVDDLKHETKGRYTIDPVLQFDSSYLLQALPSRKRLFNVRSAVRQFEHALEMSWRPVVLQCCRQNRFQLC